MLSLLLIIMSAFKIFRVSFELEPGAVGNTTDFKEANKRLEWGLKKARINAHFLHLFSDSILYFFSLFILRIYTSVQFDFWQAFSFQLSNYVWVLVHPTNSY